jgi:hypothetical protein
MVGADRDEQRGEALGGRRQGSGEGAEQRPRLRRPRRDQAVEGVEHVLHLLAGQRVDVGRAGDAPDERDDLGAVDAAVDGQETGRSGQPEDSADLRLGSRAGVPAGA